MRYRLAIFDFDGTLADSLPWFIGAMNDAADRYRFRRVLEEEIETMRGWEARKIVEHLGVPMWRMPVIVRHMRDRMASEVGRIPLFPGVERMLEELKARGVEIAIVTSNSEANVRGILGPANVARVRHFGCGASMFGKRPKMRKVLRESGVRPAEAIAIGDEIRDAHAAGAEGIPFGAVTWGYTSRDALIAHRPAEIFDAVEEIVQRLA